jgi:hypothetical protein
VQKPLEVMQGTGKQPGGVTSMKKVQGKVQGTQKHLNSVKKVENIQNIQIHQVGRYMVYQHELALAGSHDYCLCKYMCAGCHIEEPVQMCTMCRLMGIDAGGTQTG